MALFQCNFYSEILGLSSSMNVILPQDTSGTGTKREYPVLFLLHGLSDDHTIWLRKTSIERYVEGMDLAVVMPAVHRSFYTDMRHGYKYWTFISEELPSIVRSFFPISAQRDDNFVAGLSMGGYGAFKLALRCPDKFSAAASLSGVVDILNAIRNWPDEEFSLIFDEYDKVKGSGEDLFHLAEQTALSRGPKPKLFQCCGTEDFLYGDNARFRDFCRTLPLDYTYEEEPGVHEWTYWDKKIRRVLEWLPGYRN